MWDRGTLTFKGLANAFPAAGFQPGGSRFQRALGLGNLPSMQSCVDAWDEKRLEVNHPAVGPLSQTILNAGHGMGSQTALHTRQSATSQPLRMQLFDTKIIHAFNAYQHGAREKEDHREERLQPEHARSSLSTRHMLGRWMRA